MYLILILEQFSCPVWTNRGWTLCTSSFCVCSDFCSYFVKALTHSSKSLFVITRDYMWCCSYRIYTLDGNFYYRESVPTRYSCIISAEDHTAKHKVVQEHSEHLCMCAEWVCDSLTQSLASFSVQLQIQRILKVLHVLCYRAEFSIFPVPLTAALSLP